MPQQKLIGICLSTIHEEDRFFLVKALNKHAVSAGYRIVVFNSCADLYEQTYDANLGSSAVFRLIPYDELTALVIMPNIMYENGVVDEIIVKAREHHLPVISIDKELEGCVKVSFNNGDVFEKLCRHVIEDHGARKIYMMAGFKDNVYSEERIAAFRRALEANGIRFDERNIGYGCFWEQPTLDVLHDWFDEGKKEIPDAIICANDFMAITTSAYLQRRGVKIPEQCIVTGFDGISQAEYLPPKLTTCKQDFDRMGALIVELVGKLEKGEEVDNSYSVDFNIHYSQSCGCEPMEFDHINDSILALINSLRMSDERAKMVGNAQASIPMLTDVNYLPRILMNKFRFNTCVFAVNRGVFSPPDFGSNYKDDHCFSDNVDILYHRYNGNEYERCKIPTSRLLPRFDLICEDEKPIVVCCSNFTDMILGYCVFQPDVDIDEYDKMHSMMSTVGAALGIFHSRMQVRCVNDELQNLSQRDFMTGMYNRRGFFAHLERIVHDGKNFGSSLVFISADLDDLKYINDTFGHAEGDNAIITVGRALMNSSTRDEICGRFGGDEFSAAVVVPKDRGDAFYREFRAKFLGFLSDYNSASGKPYKISASIGCESGLIDGNLKIDDLIRVADEKMYAQKSKHKHRR